MIETIPKLARWYLPRLFAFEYCLAILSFVTAARLLGLHFSVVELFVDEAQYWAWSRDLDFGYYSKPPLLAWIIAGFGLVCGSGESCIRATSPIFYFGTALLGYATARELYDDRVAFWAAIAIVSAPGVAFSARIASTDVPLLFFWTLALLAYVHILRGGGLRWTVTLGFALGLGLLAKYAMIYFVIGAAIVSVIDHDSRKLLGHRNIWLAVAIAGLLIAPNVIWNALHQFDTLNHTRGLVSTGSIGFKPGKGLEFIAAQFAVFGPVVFGFLLAIIFGWNNSELSREDRWMLAFSIPPLALITTLAFLHGSYANWAAPAFISAAILVSAVLVRDQMWTWLKIHIAFAAFVQVVLLFGDASADRVTASVFGQHIDPYRRTMGWRQFASETGRIALRENAQGIIGNTRSDVASLVYYLRDTKPRVFMWPREFDTDNYFGRTVPLTEQAGEPLLLVTDCPHETLLEKFYQNVSLVGSFDSRSGPTSFRRYFAFRLEGGKGAIHPLGKCG